MNFVPHFDNMKVVHDMPEVKNQAVESVLVPNATSLVLTTAKAHSAAV